MSHYDPIELKDRYHQFMTKYHIIIHNLHELILLKTQLIVELITFGQHFVQFEDT